MRSRAEYRKVKQLLLSLRGSQVTFYLPTFADDLKLVANIAATDLTFDIENVGYTRHAQANGARSVVHFAFTDGTSLVRVVTDSSIISDTVERLTVSANFPDTRTVAEVSRIQYYELSRFATTTFAFQHERVGLISLTAQVKQLVQ